MDSSTTTLMSEDILSSFVVPDRRDPIDPGPEGIGVNSGYDWLPDRHLGVVATLAHADEVIAHVATLLFEYQQQPKGIVRLHEVVVGNYSETVVAEVAPVPAKVALLVSDALVSLRNALEHTIFAEVQHLDGLLDSQKAQLVEMPATQTYEKFRLWAKRRAKLGSWALGRGGEMLRRIEALQPHQRTQAPAEHPMALLASHTNTYKHRAPAIAAVRIAAIHREDSSPPSINDVQRLPEVPVCVGDVLARTPRGVQIPVALFPTVGIGRPGTDRWPVLMNELEYLSAWVRTQAVPRLITGLEPEKPSLPSHYDISRGHVNDRAAISVGSVTSAARRYQVRLGAASARIDLVEIIAQMENAPSRQQISGWLSSLDDEHVVARLGSIVPQPDYHPAHVLSNLAVLERMRDEARKFTPGTDDPAARAAGIYS